MRRNAIALAALAVAVPVSGCEPILPFMKVAGGPFMITESLIVLLAAILLKCVLFAVFQKELSYVHAGFSMLAGNILTTFVGAIVSVMIGSGAAFLIAIPIIFLLAWLPARRVPYMTRAKISAGGAAALMTLGLVISVVLFGAGQAAIYYNNLALYWVIKLGAVYAALIVSIVLTSLWEEWVVWKSTRRAPSDTTFVRPVLRANLYTILGVMIYAAALMIPKRLEAPDFLVQLMTLWR